MIKKLIELYKSGRLRPDGLFAKTASYIISQEMKKVATQEKEIIDLIKAMKSEGSTFKDIAQSLSKLNPDRGKSILTALAEQAKKAKPSGYVGKAMALFRANPTLAKGLGVGAGLAALGLGTKLMEHAEKKKKEKQFEDVFKSILKKNPEFDKAKAQNLFNVIKTVAPTIASDPTAAEGFIQPHMEWPTLPYTALKDVSQIEKNIHDVNKDNSNIISDAFSEVGGALAALLTLGS